MTDQTQPGTVARRRLLQAAIAAPVAGAALAASAAAQSTPEAMPAGTPSAATPIAGTPVATPVATGGFDPASPRFTIAVLPDTQYLYDEDSAVPTPLEATFDWLIANRADRNIAFMAHLGDVVEHGDAGEIARASETFQRIDGQIPYSVQTGNHDIDGGTDDQRGETPYLTAFNPDRFALSPTFASASADGYNSYHVVAAGGRQWLVLVLDWRVSAAGLVWAQGVLDANPTLPVILTTHEFVSADDFGTAELSENGETLWDGLVAGNDQIFLVLNGHFWPTGRATLTNDAGNAVHAHITNYQDRYFGGAAMIRLYTFDLTRNVIDVETFSPWLMGIPAERRTPLEAEHVELSGPVERFTVELPFRERFAGFAPPAPVAARPAAAVMPEGTAAYWRFDAEGLAATPGTVPDGAVATDLTGNGNDLTVERIGAAGPETLTWTEDHHERQPAHASLLFGGGKEPDRGALLRTGPDAPINSETFEGGYTIETFFKLPDPFEGDHAWMGILSWEGRNGDAGKTTGYDTAEPTCSLNVTSERFLQYVVYPKVQDADPTSWSHAIPAGRWTHIAIVNDGQRTLIYIDGSLIARNPSQPSTGIQTMGLPFVVGGTGYDLGYGQGFYGSIGDVRIVARALTPSEFLAPFA